MEKNCAGCWLLGWSSRLLGQPVFFQQSCDLDRNWNQGLTGLNRPGRCRCRSGPAGPVIRRVEFFLKLFDFFSPVPAGPMAFSDRIKHFFQKNSPFFHPNSPEPPPKPSYGPKKHPQTLKKNDDFFKKFEILIKSSIKLHLDLLGPGFDHLE